MSSLRVRRRDYLPLLLPLAPRPCVLYFCTPNRRRQRWQGWTSSALARVRIILSDVALYRQTGDNDMLELRRLPLRQAKGFIANLASIQPHPGYYSTTGGENDEDNNNIIKRQVTFRRALLHRERFTSQQQTKLAAYRQTGSIIEQSSIKAHNATTTTTTHEGE